MASKPIFDPIDRSAFEPSAVSKAKYAPDPFEHQRRKARKGPTRKIPLKTSDWATRFIKVKDGEKGAIVPIEFSERRYLKRTYDTEARELLLMTSRQTEKSTTLGNRIVALCGMNRMQNTLFVTPSATQTKVFSSARIDDIVEISPLVRALTHKSLTWNILQKEFLTGSRIYLRYAFLNADRIRGISVSNIFYDEVQDLLKDVLPVIKESASKFLSALHVYSGTPKTMDNSIEHLWSRQSTMSEWVIPCEHHYPWHWNVLGMKNIGKKGPICDKCGNAINPEHPHAQWVAMNKGAHVEGYRICRLMVPWYFKPDFTKKNPYKMWHQILHEMENYPIAQFMNEIMAVSYDSGTKPLTLMDVVNACDETGIYRMDEDAVAALGQSHQLYGGIDWGTGDRAYTVLSVAGYTRPDTGFQVVYSKRFDGALTDPEAQLEEIKRLIRKFRLRFVGCDWGFGFFQNKNLSSEFGPKRIHQFMYASKLQAKIVFKKAMLRWVVFRTPVMADVFNAIKKKKIRLPSYEVYKAPYAEDCLSIHAEYSESLRMIKYDKAGSGTDDTFHSILYALLVSFFDHKRPDIMAPIQEAATETEAADRFREETAIEEIENHLALEGGTGEW